MKEVKGNDSSPLNYVASALEPRARAEATQFAMEQKIRAEGLHDPTIHFWLTQQQVSGFTWNETLEYIVMSLLDDKRAYRKQAVETYQRRPEQIAKSVAGEA